MKGVLSFTDEELVSSDFIHNVCLDWLKLSRRCRIMSKHSVYCSKAARLHHSSDPWVCLGLCTLKSCKYWQIAGVVFFWLGIRQVTRCFLGIEGGGGTSSTQTDSLRNSSIYDSKATLQNNLKGEKRFFKIVSFGSRGRRCG